MQRRLRGRSYSRLKDQDSIEYNKRNLKFRTMNTHIEDDDAPPDLVDVTTMSANPDSVKEEESTPRVPITLVTGTELDSKNVDPCN